MNRAIVAGDRPKWRLTSIHSTTEDITRTGLLWQTPATLAQKGHGDEIDRNRYEPMRP